MHFGRATRFRRLLVKKWLEKHKNRIEVCYLPAYSPELNPDEYLNGVKNAIRAFSPARSPQELAKKTRSHMMRLQKRAEQVACYFQHRCIRYAA
ncbi:transposase [Xenorhabdus nematophila]|uniref:transposase n=1 Tax=Xenorhabdus nematophila TaxID=628 RepID=UPI003D6EDF7F